MRYTALLIDIDETILDFAAAERCALEAAFSEKALPYSPEIFEIYHVINDNLWKAYERAEIDKSVIPLRRFEQLYETLGLDGDPAELAETFVGQLSNQGQMIDGAADFLNAIQRDFSLYAVTNGLKRVQSHRFDRADLWKYFKDVFISEQVGYGKPDKRYFDYVLGHIDESDSAKVLVIGDSMTSDIKGANNAGLDSCLFDRNGSASPGAAAPTYTAANYREILDVLYG